MELITNEEYIFDGSLLAIVLVSKTDTFTLSSTKVFKSVVKREFSIATKTIDHKKNDCK